LRFLDRSKSRLLPPSPPSPPPSPPPPSPPPRLCLPLSRYEKLNRENTGSKRRETEGEIVAHACRWESSEEESEHLKRNEQRCGHCKHWHMPLPCISWACLEDALSLSAVAALPHPVNHRPSFNCLIPSPGRHHHLLRFALPRPWCYTQTEEGVMQSSSSSSSSSSAGGGTCGWGCGRLEGGRQQAKRQECSSWGAVPSTTLATIVDSSVNTSKSCPS